MRAAETAASMSSAEAASTLQISDSSLRKSQCVLEGGVIDNSYVGLMLVIFWPPVAFTNSLLMNRPVGKVIFLPFGAVRSTLRSVILKAVDLETQRWKGGLVIEAAPKARESRVWKGLKRAEASTTFMGMR